MREIWSDVERWQRAGMPVALATVVDVKGSSLRPPGSKMAISALGDISGSVTGGCVEGAVFEEAQAVLESGMPRLLSYGVSDETAWGVGLSCGGSIQVFVESITTAPWQLIYPVIQECLEAQQLAVLTTIVAGPGLGNKRMLLADGRQFGDMRLPELNQGILSYLTGDSTTYDPMLITLPTSTGEVSIFIDFVVPSPRLIIVGAVHIAIPLVTLAKILNFRTIVVDARSAFATRDRFPHADELIVDWPANVLKKLRIDPATCVVCLSHDEKLDNPALQVALDSPARYIGALGSRLTHTKRLNALREAGLGEHQLARIHSPVGLELGARHPEEIALAIMAEIVATQHGILRSRSTLLNRNDDEGGRSANRDKSD